MRVFGVLSAGSDTEAPGWQSDITDDHSPFELSIALDHDRVDLRMLVEARDAAMCDHFGWTPALALNERLRQEAGVDMSRFEAVRDLFAPDPRQPPRFSLWHAAVVSPQQATRFKAYLNPQVLGAANAPGLVQDFLRRVERPEAWAAVRSLLALGSGDNELLYVALDLEAGAHARVKVYVGHRGAHVGTLEQQLSRFERYTRGHATRVIGQLAEHDGPFEDRPVITCLGFANAWATPELTLHFPARCYVSDDAALTARLRSVIDHSERGERLERALREYAERDLASGRGLVTYVSLRRSDVESNASPRLTLYLSPELREVASPQREHASPSSSEVLPIYRHAASTPSSLAEVLEHAEYSKTLLRNHPFLRHLEHSSEAADVQTLARGLAFYVMAFQDVLRLVAERTTDAQMKRIAAEHFREDAGHERWFLHDASILGVDLDIGRLFSNEARAARDVSYAIVAEVLQATDDAARCAVVFALEAVGELFFGRVIALLERANAIEGMRYFGRHHQQVEANHALFDSDAALRECMLTPSAAEAAKEGVDRVFAEMTKLADSLHEELATARWRQSS